MQDDYVFWTREPQISRHSLETAPGAENRSITKATGISLNSISVFRLTQQKGEVSTLYITGCNKQTCPKTGFLLEKK